MILADERAGTPPLNPMETHLRLVRCLSALHARTGPLHDRIRSRAGRCTGRIPRRPVHNTLLPLRAVMLLEVRQHAKCAGAISSAAQLAALSAALHLSVRPPLLTTTGVAPPRELLLARAGVVTFHYPERHSARQQGR